MTIERETPAEEYSGLFAIPQVDPNGGSLLKVGGVAATLARPDDDLVLLIEKLRNQTKAGYLPPVAREIGPMGAYLYDFGSVLLAAILWRLAELGISSAAAMRAVSLAATTWNGDDLEALTAVGEPHRSPIAQLLRFYAAGARRFHIELRSVAPREGGDVDYAARLICAEADQCTSWTRPIAAFETRATVLVGIDDVMAALGERRITVN